MNNALKKVLITDPIDASCINILEKNGIDVEYKPKLPVSEILEQIKDADGLIVRSGTTVTAEIINAATKLKIIGRAGVGVDNIDCDAATHKGVVVINAPGGNTLSAAEHTCAMMLAMTRYIPQGTASLKGEKWDRAKYMGNEVNGKTLAIIGLGRIGREVAYRMQSFGMTTIGYDPLVSAEDSEKFNVKWLPLNEIWPLADFITLHVPLIPQTKDLISSDVLAKCKKGVRIVNVARGGIIDEEAIHEALESGQCGGLAVDVYIEEPPKEFKLIKHPKVVCTPHLGASTQEAQVKVAQEISDQFVDFVAGKPLHGAVNAPSLNEAQKETRKPWAALAQALGLLVTSITPSGSKQEFNVTVHKYGKDLDRDGNLFLSSTLIGILEKKVTTAINLINAPALASAVGIQAKAEYKQEGGLATPSLAVEIAKDGHRHIAIGSTAGSLPLLLAIDSVTFPVAVPLQGTLLLFKSSASQRNLTAIIDAVSQTNIPINFISESDTKDDLKWTLVGVCKKLELVDKLQLVAPSFVTQISF